MKLVRVNFVLEYEDVDGVVLQDYLDELNEYLIDMEGTPQLVDADLSAAILEDLEEEDEDDDEESYDSDYEDFEDDDEEDEDY